MVGWAGSGEPAPVCCKTWRGAGGGSACVPAPAGLRRYCLLSCCQPSDVVEQMDVFSMVYELCWVTGLFFQGLHRCLVCPGICWMRVYKPAGTGCTACVAGSCCSQEADVHSSVLTNVCSSPNPAPPCSEGSGVRTQPPTWQGTLTLPPSPCTICVLQLCCLAGVHPRQSFLLCCSLPPDSEALLPTIALTAVGFSSVSVTLSLSFIFVFRSGLILILWGQKGSVALSSPTPVILGTCTSPSSTAVHLGGRMRVPFASPVQLQLLPSAS